MSDKMREALEWLADEMRSELTDDGASLPQWLVKSWLRRCTQALAEQPAQGEAVGHVYRLIVEGQVVGTRYMDGPKLFGVFGKPGRDHGGKETATAIYTAPPAPKEVSRD